MNTAPLKYQIFLFLLFTIYYLLFTISPALAQSPNPQINSNQPTNQINPNPYLNPNTNPDVPKNLHTWTQTVMIEVMSAMSCQLTGIDPTDPKSKCLGVDQKTGNIGFVEGGGGAIGVAGKMIAMLYTPPLHTGDYFRYLADNFGIAKSAHAAGFEGLKPVQSLWIAFRNVVYLLFVIIFIVIGLAIMLRVRIDPRTVMTIQNQIPKIIIGLLLLTFSFAIAGFLIDLMYVVIFLSYEVISGAGVLDAKGVLVDFSKLNPLNLQNSSPFASANGVIGGGIFGIAHSVALSVREIIAQFLNIGIAPFALDDLLNITGILKFDEGQANTPGYSIFDAIIDLVSIEVAMRLGANIAEILGTVLGTSLGTIPGTAVTITTFAVLEGLLRWAIPYLIVFFIVFIALLIALIRLWFVLIMAYIGILLDVVFAPFWIAASLLPGVQIGFGAWLRSIIANLAVFPTVIIMFLLAKAFIDAFGASKATTDFVPPLIGNLPGTDLLGPLIGLGIILMTPSVVAMVKAALGVKGVGVGPMIVGAIAGGFNAPGGMLATAGHLGGAVYGLSHLAGVIPGGERIPFLRRLRGQQGQQGP